MSATVKSIYATISNHVRMVGYKEIVEAHGRARGLTGFVYDDVDESVKVMASGPEPVLSELIHDLKKFRPDTVIETTDIKEDIRLPTPFGKIAVDDVLEYMARFDKGIRILTEHTGILKDHSVILTEHTAILKENTKVLHSMNEELNTASE